MRWPGPQGGWLITPAPEPGQPPAKLESFPDMGNGIKEAAVQLVFLVERTVEQPDGQSQRWHAGREIDHRLLVSAGRVFTMTGMADKSARPEKDAPFFASNEPSDYSVGYLEFYGEEAVEGEFVVDIPAGELTVQLDDFVGKPDLRALYALGLHEKPGTWLPASFSATSDWVPRLVDLKGWERGTGIAFHAKQVKRVEPGETVEIRVASPAAEKTGD